MKTKIWLFGFNKGIVTSFWFHHDIFLGLIHHRGRLGETVTNPQVNSFLR